MSWLLLLICKHKWEMLSEQTTDSMFDNAAKTASATAFQNVKIPQSLCDGERTVIQICTCQKCGALKRFVTKI